MVELVTGGAFIYLMGWISCELFNTWERRKMSQEEREFTVLNRRMKP